MMTSHTRIRTFVQPLLAIMLLVALGTAITSTANAGEKYKFSYYANGRLCVDTIGNLDGKRPITEPPVKSWEDFKPSWSKTGNRLVFFRRVKNDKVTVNWKTVLCTIKSDGTDREELTDDKHTNFNPTWTRDGKNNPIWNRKQPKGNFAIIRSKVGNKPEQLDVLTDPRYHNWVHSCLKDGRVLAESAHPTQGYGLYLMTPKPKGKSTYQRINDGGLLKKGLMARISVSPDETKICFGHIKGPNFMEPGHAMTVADFNVRTRKITNPKVFANKEQKPFWYAYPRWTKDGKAIIYFANTTGKGKLYLYTLRTGKTKQISTNDSVDYRYPHGEATPK